jgi:hypothetical protein
MSNWRAALESGVVVREPVELAHLHTVLPSYGCVLIAVVLDISSVSTR